MLMEVKSVTKRFGGLAALSDVSFNIEEGAIIGIIGPNGAGKTTLFNCICGLLDITDGDVVVGMSARLEEVKGHIYLIEAARILRERGMKNLRVLIIGTGATEGMLKAKVREYALEDCVIFAGFVSDVAPYIEVMDAIINCSFGTEATSMALIEAMSLAKPAIATDYGGNAYIIENGKNGYIIPQKSASNLADAIAKLFEDPVRLAEMSKVAYSKYICRLTGKIMTGKVEKLYEDGYAARCRK